MTTTNRPPSAIPHDLRLVDAIVQISFLTTAVLSRIAAAHDLSLTQLRVLAILRDRRVQMSELASYLGLDRSTISGLVDRGEKRGLLERAPNPLDARGVDVALTPAGLELADLGAAQVAFSLAPVLNTVSPTESQRLASLLERMLAGPPPAT